MFIKNIKTLVLTCIIIWGHIILPSVLAGSLIKTPHGLISIENCIMGRSVIGYDTKLLFIIEQGLLTHNAAPVIVVSLAWLFGEGLKFAGLSIGASALGTYVGVELYNKNKQSNAAFDFSPQPGTCGGYNPDPDDNENSERKFNTLSKSEFFKTVQKDYEHYRNGIYKRKKGAKGIEKAEYLEWDHLHSDVEAYSKGGKHLGSIDPKSLRIYKGPVVRTLPL